MRISESERERDLMFGVLLLAVEKLRRYQRIEADGDPLIPASAMAAAEADVDRLIALHFPPPHGTFGANAAT